MTETRRFDPLPVTEWDDVQALVKTGFGTLKAAAYLLLQVRDAPAARTWLAQLRPTSVADGVVGEAVQAALTAPGLAALGLDDDVLRHFDAEFRAGMAGDDSRSRRLGDVGPNAPANWRWGQGAQMPHLLVMLYAQPETLPALQARISTELATGFTQIGVEDSGNMQGREPFGFLDGISQPVVDWDGVRKPGNDAAYTHLLASGEVLLGYPNEYKCLTDRPLLDPAIAPDLPRAFDRPGRVDLGRNGSYLVYRRLAQDVRGFWRWAKATAGSIDAAYDLAETLVGRAMSGQPAAGLGTRVIPGAKDYDLNNFSYCGDSAGHIVALGSHIRRANLRNADLPRQTTGVIDKLFTTLGLTGTPLEDAVSSTRFHRILRRGREYGSWLEPADAAAEGAADPESGLNFICLQAGIGRQFEFMQGAWLRSAKFAGLSGESDPLLGSRCPFAGLPTDSFTRPGADGGLDRFTLPQFVSVEAGAYFFLPGLRALRFIAACR